MAGIWLLDPGTGRLLLAVVLTPTQPPSQHWRSARDPRLHPRSAAPGCSRTRQVAKSGASNSARGCEAGSEAPSPPGVSGAALKAEGWGKKEAGSAREEPAPLGIPAMLHPRHSS
ncbi:hypothetical protein GHT09_014822 [Marmota monax]|uniref:Uncharacterized protein n=1 Tax=Marmota monax TaxID=9995 RepID=A0A834UJV5_MARMO|nr:hypothetical protein GHT09_014822 [Marmota monax]